MQVRKGQHRASLSKFRGPARLLTLALMSALVLVLTAGWAIANHNVTTSGVTPTEIGINPSCAGPEGPNSPDLGYDFGFKVNLAPNGTFAIGDGFNSVTISNSNGTTFDWSATLGIDAVIVKGSNSANVYVYDPEATADGHLNAPIPHEVSHIEFCFDYELDVEKTADTTFTRTFEWDIEKTVTPETWDLFTGDSGTSEYTVTVTKTGSTDSDWAVSGSITIDNNTPFSATIESVSDVISGVGAVAVDCGVSFPHALASGGTLECTYSTGLANGDNRVNTATVTTSGDVGGGSADADVIFGDPTTVVNDTINVDDSVEGDLGSFSETGSVSYTRTFTCDDDEGKHDNTATIVETEQSDDASVTVNCHALEVTKDADTSFNRYWDWTIDKSADQTDLLLSEGQLFTVNYEVTVDATSTDDDHAVAGTITVNNPAPIDAIINGVADIVSPDIAATVDCGVTFPHTLVAGDSLQCTYSADLPDGSSRTNTATATQQNHDYDSEGAATPTGTTDYSGMADVVFSGTPDSEIDECVDVNDTNVGFLGTVCADQAPETFPYSLTFGAHPDADVVLECGDNTHVNVADFVTNDTSAIGDDDWTVNASVACDTGCTLTPGYWKTHSTYGPAPSDDTWNQIGEDTAFFLSGQSYYEVLWTSPQGGNAYYILAHAYIAAELNGLNGASVPGSVQTAFDEATGLFGTYTPDDIAALKGKNGKELRDQFIALAGILDGYNNGLSGPGHCSE